MAAAVLACARMACTARHSFRRSGSQRPVLRKHYTGTLAPSRSAAKIPLLRKKAQEQQQHQQAPNGQRCGVASLARRHRLHAIVTQERINLGKC